MHFLWRMLASFFRPRRSIELRTVRNLSSSGISADKTGAPIGLIAGNGSLPARFIEEAHANGRKVVAVCHREETSEQVFAAADNSIWIKLGQLGAIISFFKEHGVQEAVMAGGVNRVRLFGGVKLDARGMALIAKLRSAKDDILMRGIADELAGEGVTIVDSTCYMQEWMAPLGTLTQREVSEEEQEDIQIGIDAIRAMSDQHIGQMVVVRDGVVVAVEAVEGTDETIARGGKLGGPGAVVVKFAKTTQDMRFDVPTIGVQTIETMNSVGARVLALEAGRCLILDKEEVVKLADRCGVTIVGCDPLVDGYVKEDAHLLQSG